MILKIRITFAFFFLLGANLLIAQQFEVDKLNFREIKEVISKRPISEITQDNRGFIWVGTQGNGLYRFDGTDAKGIDSSLDVKCMIEDEHGNLILGTYGKGVFKLSNSTLKVTKLKIGSISEMDLIVHEFAKNTKDEIYISQNT